MKKVPVIKKIEKVHKRDNEMGEREKRRKMIIFVIVIDNLII